MLEKDKTRATDVAPKTGRTKAAPRATSAAKPATPAAAGKPAASGRPGQDMHQRIERRAYELWESEGRPEGRQQAHWRQAEMEITRARTRTSM
jgi:Protein of unknown function (DUF2934)